MGPALSPKLAIISVSLVLLATAAFATEPPPGFLTKWAIPGTFGVAVGPSGSVYACTRNKVQKFDAFGTFVLEWGSAGTGDGEFNTPHEVEVDSLGNVYVVDFFNHRVQKFTSSGVFLAKWGGLGSRPGEFIWPIDLAVDTQDNVYVADFNNARIQKFDSNGNYMDHWGVWGSGPGELSGPRGVAVDSKGFVFVADSGNQRIQKFDEFGNFLQSWTGGFSSPSELTVDAADNLYLVDFGNYRIKKFDSNGVLLSCWGTFGSGDGDFTGPSGISVSASGVVYTSDHDQGRMQLFGDTDFGLATDKSQLLAGDAAVLRTFGGEPVKPALLFVIAANGLPYFVPLASATLDTNGHWIVTGTVPANPALPGNTISLRTFSLGAMGEVIQTNDILIELQ
jgi:DNA-binding beta-propeller fold protein YncE